MNLFRKLLSKRKQLVATSETSEVSKKPEEVSKKPETVQDWCREFATARERKDEDGMKNALIKAHEACKSKNSMCLSEIFCPDCPMGGLIVFSGRSGL